MLVNVESPSAQFLKGRRFAAVRFLVLSTAWGLLLLVVLLRIPRPSTVDDFVRKQPPLVVTLFDYNYRFLGANFLCNLRRLGLQGDTVVVAKDDKIQQFLGVHFADYNVVSIESLQTSLQLYETQHHLGVHQFATPAFNRVTRVKIDASLGVMLQNPDRDIIFSDGDITWCQDATVPLLNLVLLDESRADLYFGVNPPAGYLNSGFYYARNTQKMRDFLFEFKDEGDGDDQTAFKRMLCKAELGRRTTNGCMNVYGIRTRLLDNRIFSNGKVPYMDGDLLDFDRETIRNECNPFSGHRATLHWNYIDGPLKSERMKQGGVWHVNESTIVEERQTTEYLDVCLDEPVYP